MSIPFSRRALAASPALPLAAPRVLRAQERMRVRLVLDFGLDGSPAPFYHAEARSYFRAAGPGVQIGPSGAA